MYNPSTDQWSTISPIPEYAACMGYCEIDNHIYIFGGYSFEDLTHHQCVQRYDASTGTWTQKLMNNKNINFFPCVVVDLPVGFMSRFSQ